MLRKFRGMSYRDQIRRMRRQFHKDVTLLRDQQEQIEIRLDRLYGAQDQRFGLIENNLRDLQAEVGTLHNEVGTLHHQVGTLHGQVGTMHSQVGKMQLVLTAVIDNVEALAQDGRQARIEIRDLNRTLVGRMRLMEERMGIFMDVLETQNGSLEERVTRLEQRDDPAA